MNIEFTIFWSVLLLYFVTCVHSADRNFLLNEFNARNGTKGLINITEWRTNFINNINRELQQISAPIRAKLIAKADEENQYIWPSFRVTQFLEYVTNGNQVNFQSTYFDRRLRLEKLVIGELLTNTGKYMNQIANGLWLILEESTWVVPAHLYLQKAGFGLPDPNEPVVDLFQAESANHVAHIRLLLGMFYFSQ